MALRIETVFAAASTPTHRKFNLEKTPINGYSVFYYVQQHTIRRAASNPENVWVGKFRAHSGPILTGGSRTETRQLKHAQDPQ
ncbi:hypothetical protein AFLA_011915 [Aspergillus flavus NRRL3357]|nr:hypothetical protein AFLA_011915 [Aspergillus flavus NRRL3357]